MELIPAIDILGGRVVRLFKGDFDQVTSYADDPVAQARLFAEQGATRIHVVDLDGARTGELVNQSIVERMVRDVPAKIQLGGGIRDEARAGLWLDKGVERVVLGTFASKYPDRARALCQRHANSVVIAIDIKDGRVATQGWLESAQDALAFAKEVGAWAPAAVLCTDVARDGTAEGPNVQLTADVQKIVGCTVIASGGIGALTHLNDLKVEGVRAAVCGKALYSGAFTLKQAYAALKGTSC